MATDYEVKKSKFSTLAFQIRLENMDFFRGKTLSKVFIIGKSPDNKPALLYPKGNVPDEIKQKLTTAFKSIFEN